MTAVGTEGTEGGASERESPPPSIAFRDEGRSGGGRSVIPCLPHLPFEYFRVSSFSHALARNTERTGLGPATIQIRSYFGSGEARLLHLLHQRKSQERAWGDENAGSDEPVAALSSCTKDSRTMMPEL